MKTLWSIITGTSLCVLGDQKRAKCYHRAPLSQLSLYTGGTKEPIMEKYSLCFKVYIFGHLKWLATFYCMKRTRQTICDITYVSSEVCFFCLFFLGEGGKLWVTSHCQEMTPSIAVQTNKRLMVGTNKPSSWLEHVHLTSDTTSKLVQFYHAHANLWC